MNETTVKLNALNETEITYELCPHCDNDSRMTLEFVAQPCEHCQQVILPCGMCETMDCNNCPFK